MPNQQQNRFDLQQPGWCREKFAVSAVVCMFSFIIVSIARYIYVNAGVPIIEGDTLILIFTIAQVVLGASSLLSGLAVFSTRFFTDKPDPDKKKNL